MKKKILIIIKEQLDDFDDFFASIEQRNFIKSYYIAYAEIFSPDFRELIENTKVSNLTIVIHEALFKCVSTELNDYLESIYTMPFTNTLLIYTNDEFYKELNLLKPGRHIFCLFPHVDSYWQANGFLLYILKIFSESIISMRLHDYITDSFRERVDSEMLKKKNEEIKRLNSQLNRLNDQLTLKNKIDSLTSLYNRATIFEFLEQEQTRIKRDLWRMDKILYSSMHSQSAAMIKSVDCEPLEEFLGHYGVLTLMLIDLDMFKGINDTHGHLVGDDVLRFIGELLHDEEIFRENDLTGRWGGEEFLVILPDTNVKNAIIPANRLIEKLAKKEFDGAHNCKFKVTVSIGISQSCPEDQSKEDIIKRVDDALYYAKANGRNRIAIYEELLKK